MAPGKDSGSDLKSAYELALERLDRQGIERPREESMDAVLLERLAEVRSRAEAKLAELEILHRGRLRKLAEPQERAREEEEYVAERQRIEARRDRDLARLRSDES